MANSSLEVVTGRGDMTAVRRAFRRVRTIVSSTDDLSAASSRTTGVIAGATAGSSMIGPNSRARPACPSATVRTSEYGPIMMYSWSRGSLAGLRNFFFLATTRPRPSANPATSVE